MLREVVTTFLIIALVLFFSMGATHLMRLLWGAL